MSSMAERLTTVSALLRPHTGVACHCVFVTGPVQLQRHMPASQICRLLQRLMETRRNQEIHPKRCMRRDAVQKNQ